MTEKEGLYELVPNFSQINCGPFIVAGTSYRCKQEQVNKLQTGDKIKLKREPENEYDANAIACYAFIEPGPTHIGYIPATIAKHIAPLIDNGLVFTALVRLTGPKCSIHSTLFWEKPEEEDN